MPAISSRSWLWDPRLIVGAATAPLDWGQAGVCRRRCRWRAHQVDFQLVPRARGDPLPGSYGLSQVGPPQVGLVIPAQPAPNPS